MKKKAEIVLGWINLAILAIILFYGLFFGKLVEAIVAIVVLFVFGGMIVSGLEKLAKFRKHIASCRHGVRGAAEDSRRCPECFAIQKRSEEVERQLADKQQQLEEKQRRRENQRRRRENQQRIAKWKEQLRTPEYLKRIDPRQFEELCGLLFEELGYDVEVTRYVSDGGVDAFLRKDGSISLLQCKRVQGSVGEPILRDLFGSMMHNGAKDGIVVTTGTVSAAARKWVYGKPIRIIELAELVRLLELHISKDAIVPKSFSVNVSTQTVMRELRICPRCGKSLKERTGRHGKFLGCTGYPECTYSFSRRWKHRA